MTPSAGIERLVVAVRDLAAAQSMQEVVEIVRHAARQLVRADGATFVLRDDGKCHYVDEDAIEPLWRGQKFPLEACISGWAMLHAQAVHIKDIYDDDRIPHEAYRPTFVRSLTMTPVRTTDPLAAIGTYWADQHQTTAEEADLLQALADSTAVALESLRVRSDLEETVARRTAELEEANKDLAAFAHLAAHDLRAPLTTVRGFTELALDIDRDNLSADGLEALETTAAQVDRMRRLIDAILSYSTLTTAEIVRDDLDFNEVASAVLGDIKGLLAERHAVVEVQLLPHGYASGPLMERVLQNLIANAVLYGDAVSPVVRVGGAVHDDGSVELTVSDNGGGVSAQDRDAIFEMFTRGAAGRQAEGSGIGLAFVARVVAKHGGTIAVDKGELGGACFTVCLPAAA